MTTETTPGSVQTTDNLRIAFVPDGNNALSVAVLTANTTKLITYSLTPDGWSFPIAETEVNDPRLTQGVQGSKPGSSKYGPIALKYVFGTVADVAKAALQLGVSGTIVYRDILPNATEWAVGQKVDTVKVTCGRQRKDAPATDGLYTTSQSLYVQPGGYLEAQTLVA
ncbi:phage tail tube protein [Herbiconiux solani]|uniref:phage tail tube protein n=1 Tax=Herbiconiux solani TaxID=661329 RepID=UPI000824C1A5|nr:hypothetical protein [Herbiconiux solani]